MPMEKVKYQGFILRLKNFGKKKYSLGVFDQQCLSYKSNFQIITIFKLFNGIFVPSW